MAILAACAVMFAAASCMKKTSGPAFGTISDSEIVRQDDRRLELDYHFEFLSDYSDKAVLAKIQRAMTADFLGEDYVVGSPEASVKAYRDSLVNGFVGSYPDDYRWDGFDKIRSYTHVLSNRVIVYTVEDAYYMGGAHGMETTAYSNYDLRTGERLTLGDLFTPEGIAALEERIVARILKDHGVSDWDALMEESCYFAQEEIEPTENFKLSEEFITFFYNPYEIACYAQGYTKVKLPLGELAGFRKEMIAQ